MARYVIVGKPFSTTNSKRIIRVGKERAIRIIPSREAQEWLTVAMYQLNTQRGNQPMIEGRCDIDMKVYLERDAGDVDNYAKGILDALQRTRILRNDALVVKLCVEKFVDRANPRVELTITERPSDGHLFAL